MKTIKHFLSNLKSRFFYSGTNIDQETGIKGTVEWNGYTADYFIGQAYEYGKMEALNQFKKAVMSRDWEKIDKVINKQMKELKKNNRDELGTKLLNLFIKYAK